MFFVFADGSQRYRSSPSLRDGDRVHAPSTADTARARHDIRCRHRRLHPISRLHPIPRQSRRPRPTHLHIGLRSLQHSRFLPPPGPNDRGTPTHKSERSLRRIHLLPFQRSSIRLHKTIPHHERSYGYSRSVRTFRRFFVTGHNRSLSPLARDERQIFVTN